MDYLLSIAAAFALVTAIRILAVNVTWLLMQSLNLAKWLFKPSAIAGALFLSVVFIVLKKPLDDMWEFVYTRFVEPAGAVNVTSDKVRQALRAELREKVDGYTYEVVERWTDSTARAIGCQPEAIYMVALLECGLNPFRVRDDRVAAGWLQFTRVGLQRHGVRLEKVIDACNRKDAHFVMALSHAYLTERQRQHGRPLNTAIDVYLAVFAPAKIGQDGSAVIYEGASNPAYYMNSGLDGWKISTNGVIYRSQKDGRITVEELYLCMMRRVSLCAQKWNGI